MTVRSQFPIGLDSRTSEGMGRVLISVQRTVGTGRCSSASSESREKAVLKLITVSILSTTLLVATPTWAQGSADVGVATRRATASWDALTQNLSVPGQPGLFVDT